MGRPPRGRWRVARRCRCGLPQVIETEPRLDDGTPFPTMWWLTCKKLCSAVGTLESSGWMAGFNEKLKSDDELQKALGDSIERYAQARSRLGGIESIAHPGGGPARIKCLHAHVAHYLVNADNEAGRLAMMAIGPEPTTPCLRGR